MGVFRQFPYSNFHEMNMDDIIKITKNMLEEWAQYHAEWETWKNQINDDWSNYQEVMNEAWQNMQNFINNYFDNLDVQEEINNKIVSMVNTGEFGQIMSPYVPPAVSAWLAEHITTPETVVIDDTLSIQGACADAKATGDAIIDVWKEFKNSYQYIFPPELNKCDPNLITQGVIIGNASGRIDENENYQTTDFIDVSNFTHGYSINVPTRRFLAYDEFKNALNGSYDETYYFDRAIPLNSNYKYIRFSIPTGIENIMVADSDTVTAYVEFKRRLIAGVSALNSETQDEIEAIIPSALFFVGKNKCNPEEFVSGFINSANGTIGESEYYFTTGYIDVSNFQYGYAVNHRYRKALAYDADMAPIVDSYVTDETQAGVIPIDSDWKYLRFSFVVADGYNVMVEDSASITPYEPYQLTLLNGVSALNDITKAQVEAIASADTKGVLYGKKWYACGDSFTIGDFTGLADGYTFEDEPYMGQPKVYPFFIGRRCGMDVVNLAVGGQTLAKVPGRTNFVDAVYQSVGADADYITIKLGINDGHQSVPIGTIDSTNIETFYGAWNTVLTWLITNRPTAKIGLIVSNGLDSNNYAEATIAIAHKYGLPYLNEWSGEQVPLLIRSGRTDVEQSIKDIRNTTFRVSENNLHPNVACHEYESSFVEEWLRSL